MATLYSLHKWVEDGSRNMTGTLAPCELSIYLIPTEQLWDDAECVDSSINVLLLSQSAWTHIPVERLQHLLESVASVKWQKQLPPH